MFTFSKHIDGTTVKSFEMLNAFCIHRYFRFQLTLVQLKISYYD